MKALLTLVHAVRVRDFYPLELITLVSGCHRAVLLRGLHHQELFGLLVELLLVLVQHMFAWVILRLMGP